MWPLLLATHGTEPALPYSSGANGGQGSSMEAAIAEAEHGITAADLSSAVGSSWPIGLEKLMQILTCSPYVSILCHPLAG